MQPVSRKTYLLVLCAAAVLALGLTLALLPLSRAAAVTDVMGDEIPLHISELMSKNTAFANADGVICDWIEIENTSDRDINLSGYRLSDDVTEARFAFPVGTVIPAGGYVTVWCSTEHTGGLYAPFALKNQGGETIYLMNRANTVLDEVDTLRGERNCSLIRQSDGSLSVSSAPTPGYANTDEGYAAYLASVGTGSGTIRLSEIMTSAFLYRNGDGAACDWIELTNTGTETEDISGMHLSDKEGENRYTIPEGTVLAPGAYLVVWCSGELTGFGLSGDGENVILTDQNGSAVDRIRVPALAADTSYARTGGGWAVSEKATPGFENSEDGYRAWLASVGCDSVDVRLVTLCPRNKTGLADASGERSDWIEIKNFSSEAVSLEGWYLSDDPADATRWEFPDVTLNAGETLRIFCSGKNRTGSELHTDFSLSVGETVTLTMPAGARADEAEVPFGEADTVWCLSETGEWTEAGKGGNP